MRIKQNEDDVSGCAPSFFRVRKPACASQDQKKCQISVIRISAFYKFSFLEFAVILSL